MNKVRDYIAAHRKALVVALGGVLILFVDKETADEIIGGVTLALTILVPNDAGATARIYGQ